MKGQGGPRQARWAAVIAVVAVLSVACGGDGDDEGTPSPTIAEPTTIADPYAIPAVIDAAYVNRVLQGIDAAMSDVVRLVIKTREIPPEVVDRLKSLYDNPDLLQLRLDSFVYLINTNAEGFRSDPGNQKTTVTDLVSASPGCIFARVSRDYSEVVITPKGQSTEWVGLKPGIVPVKSYNPTTWVLIVDGRQPDGSSPSNPCVSRR